MKPACSSIWSSVIPMTSRSFRTLWTAGSARSMPTDEALLRPGEGVLIVTSRGGMID